MILPDISNLNKEEKENLESIMLNVKTVELILEHYKTSNWLWLRDFKKILKEAERQTKEELK
jgi:iron uptake system EfeUOB component EfeO/EfeM